MDLEDRVYFLGKVSDSVLKSCYLGCHYYVSMSEHEGFCIPLLEAFYFGLPVLAYSAAAVPETMGGVGILFTAKDYPLLAEMVDRMERDPGLKRVMLEAQRGRLEDFGAERFARKLRAVVDTFLKEKQGSGVG
jgi:glycosyltransferase involved in cell wall biosynthesis